MAKAQIETVLGPVNAEDLGITFTHEHLTIDYSRCTLPPAKEADKSKMNEPITLANLNWLKHNPYSCVANLNLAKEKDAVLSDLKLLKQAGGCTIVENTCIGINRDVPAMIEFAKLSGLNVVCGTGYYVAVTQTDSVKNTSVEEMTKVLLTCSQCIRYLKLTRTKYGRCWRATILCFK
jgi:phosphotriesterase-related protein